MNFKFILAVLSGCAVFSMAQAQSFDSTFLNCIAKNETSGVEDVKAAAIVNKAGYTGIYQMGVNYVGGYLCSNHASIPEMPPGKQNWALCDFKGTLAKQYGINSYEDFKSGSNAVAVQNAIMMKNSESTWKRIQNDPNMNKYIGQTINGVLMTKETMVAMAHLKGYGGLQTSVAGGISVDGNGTSTTGYASCLASCMAGTGTKACSTKTGEIISVLESVCKTVKK